MSLRTKLLAFFGLLAVLPLAATGGLHYVQAMRAVERHIAAQVELIAQRAADELARRYEVRISDLLLLAGNVETQRLFRALSDGAGAAELDVARESASEYLETAWRQLAQSYQAIELRHASGTTVLRLGGQGIDNEPLAMPVGAWGAGTTLDRPIVDEDSGTRLGSVVAVPRLPDLLPREALDARFGRAGQTLVVDRGGGRLLHHSNRPLLPRAPGPTRADLGFDPAMVALAAERGGFTYRLGDSTRIAAFVSLDEPPWSVVATASLDEFARPFERMRALNLLLVLVVIASVSLASVLLVRRATRSLEELTRAAGEVARGDLLPSLPPAGPDEVGRLSGAFATMVDRIREAMAELQASRQMAAVGEFASELAHEIRNPLTSVKLNLQRIGRAVDAAGGPADAEPPLRIALREVRRLERVVRGVLSLGRRRPVELAPTSLHAVAADALDVVRPQAERQGVTLEAAFRADTDVVLGDPEQLRAAFLNLLLNALEVMPGGGELRVASALRAVDGGRDAVELTVTDTGPGVPPDLRETLFRPFVTRKPDGTGLGLAVAARAVEEHGGRIELDPDAPGAGAVFRILLPLATDRVPA
jgi:two-component system, NtrC family, sensor histidine kinase HydH